MGYFMRSNGNDGAAGSFSHLRRVHNRYHDRNLLLVCAPSVIPDSDVARDGRPGDSRNHACLAGPDEL